MGIEGEEIEYSSSIGRGVYVCSYCSEEFPMVYKREPTPNKKTLKRRVDAWPNFSRHAVACKKAHESEEIKAVRYVKERSTWRRVSCRGCGGVIKIIADRFKNPTQAKLFGAAFITAYCPSCEKKTMP